MDAVDTDLGHLKISGDKTLQHVNSATLYNLKTILRFAKRQYDTTGDEADKKEMDDAQRAVDEHEAADQKIQEEARKAAK